MHMRHCYGVLRSYLLNRTYYKYTVEYTLHNEKLAYFCCWSNTLKTHLKI